MKFTKAPKSPKSLYKSAYCVRNYFNVLIGYVYKGTTVKGLKTWRACTGATLMNSCQFHSVDNFETRQQAANWLEDTVMAMNNLWQNSQVN